MRSLIDARENRLGKAFKKMLQFANRSTQPELCHFIMQIFEIEKKLIETENL